MVASAQQESYEEALAYLTDYVNEDWVGFSVLTGTAAQLLGAGADEESLRLMLLRLVDELLQRGARAGDLTGDPEPFRPWDLDRAGTLDRIRREMEALGAPAESGDIAWLTAP
jgi:hypothetical protein